MHEHEYEENLEGNPDIYTLVDEEGNEQEFELLDVMDVEDQRYYALLPYFKNANDLLEDDGAFVVLRVEEEDGEEVMVSIDDEQEYEHVGGLFLEKISRLFEESYEEIDQQLQ